MKKKTIATIVISSVIIMVCILGGIKLKESMQVKNVFDEMYYSEWKELNYSESKGLPNMKQIEHWDRKNADLKNSVGPVIERYKSNFLGKNESLTFGFDFSEKRLLISFAETITSELLYRIDFSYSISEKLLKQNVVIFDETKDTYTITNPREIEKYLDKYQISKDFLKDKSNEVLYRTVIKDWLNTYPNHFSLKDIGEVDIEKDEFLK